MQFLHSLLAALAITSSCCFSVATAQNTSADTVNQGIANLLLQLEGTRLIPNLVQQSQFELHGLLVQQFGSQNISTGQLVEQVTEVANQPTWSAEYTAAANESKTFASTMFTIMTLDPGAASEEPRNIVRHYLANNVSLSMSTGNFQNTTKPIAGWFSPAPPAGSGVHRYATLVFRQPANFTLPVDLQNTNTTIETNFNLTDYISRTNLGPIVAANFFLAQSNDTSATVTATGVVSTTSVPAASVSAAVESVSKSLSSVYATTTAASSGSSSGAMAGPVVISHASVALAATAAFVLLGALTL